MSNMLDAIFDSSQDDYSFLGESRCTGMCLNGGSASRSSSLLATRTYSYFNALKLMNTGFS